MPSTDCLGRADHGRESFAFLGGSGCIRPFRPLQGKLDREFVILTAVGHGGRRSASRSLKGAQS
jgi:hypothetical protein